MKCPKCQTDNPETLKFCGECGTKLELSQEPAIGVTETMETSLEELTTGATFAERYQIIEELGKGGMGRVYKVLDKETNEKIALKLIKPDIASDKKTIERFRNELTIARKIVQKNVCRIYDLGKEKNSYYITMEYISGQDLKGLIRQTGQLTVGKAISIAKQICEGLCEAHSLGIVHRDLKPNNIMIDRGGNARIMDFGIARAVKGKSITGTGIMIGTPEYMSPEQVEGKDVDQRSDLYSLGVILYEMLTEQVPFEGDTPFTVGVKHKSETPRDPKAHNAQIPDDLNQLILRCLEKDREKRYQNTDDVKSDLKKIEQSLPTNDRIIPQKKSITTREITFQFRIKKLLLPIFAVIVAISIGLLLWRPWVHKAAPTTTMETPSVAVLPFEDISPQQDQDHLCRGIASELINRLNKIQNLWVPARASSFSFGGKDPNLNDVGEKLNVKTVLWGTLQKAENKLRISVELVNVADKTIIWQENYERNEGDIFDLQDDISLAILDELKIKLLGNEKNDIIKRYTADHIAYGLYLKGNIFWEKRTEESIRTAIEYFNQSIERDPRFALPYAGLSSCYLALPWYSPSSTKSVIMKAIEYAEKALAQDNSLAEAHASLAFIKMQFEHDWNSAEDEFKKAIDLNYNNSTAHQWYALFLTYLGRFDEAISEINTALQMDPLSLIVNRNVGQVYLIAREYDQAIEAIQETLKLDNSFRYAHAWLGVSYFQKSMNAEAIAELQKEADLSKGQSPIIDIYLGIAYGLMGQMADARKILAQIENRYKQDYISPVWLACLYHSLGEIDKSFDLLDRAYEEKDTQLMYLKEHPWFDNFRSDTKYRTLLKKMNLE